MLKLTRHLFCWDPQAEYADYYERALYNHILASQNPETGMMCYYVPLRSGSRKNYNGPLRLLLVLHRHGRREPREVRRQHLLLDGNDTLYVNLFVASELRGPDSAFVLRQETDFPEQKAPGSR